MRPVDLVVCGSVAVDRRGARLAKGAGYSDIELALLQEAGLIRPQTTIATTVHALQVIDEDLPEAEVSSVRGLAEFEDRGRRPRVSTLIFSSGAVGATEDDWHVMLLANTSRPSGDRGRLSDLLPHADRPRVITSLATRLDRLGVHAGDVSRSRW